MSHKVEVCKYPSLTNASGWSRVLGDESAGELTRTERDDEGDDCREFRNRGRHSTDSGFADAAGGMEDSWYLVSGIN
jgi:hypothetical protein